MNPNLADQRRRGLGRGLSALLGDEHDGEGNPERMRAPNLVRIGALRPGRFQPRRNFDAEEMAALTQSIRRQGILQPILVRRLPGEPDSYEIVAGERRWRAAQEAQLHEVPVIVRDLDDGEALELALVENLQRQDLNPLEEAEGYRRLMQEFKHTQDDLARALGKSRSHVANTIRLLELPEPVKDMVDRGELTAGHARALLTAGNPTELARQVIRKGLNVRQTEALAKGVRARASGGVATVAKDADTRALESDLSLKLGVKVTINNRGQSGDLVLRYANLSQLDDLVQRLSRDPHRN